MTIPVIVPPIPGITTSMTFVTPDMACDWLEKNIDNRKLKKDKIELYAQAILEDRWLPNHQGISFYEDGGLADGQHRLYAIIQAGRGVWMNVSYGLPRASIHCIDENTPRTYKDGLKFEKIDAESSHTSICNVLIREARRQIRGVANWRGNKVDRIVFLRCFRAWQDAILFPKVTGQVRLRNNLHMSAIAAASFTQPHDILRQYMETVSSGIIESEQDNSAIRIRDFLLINSRNDVIHRQEAYLKSCSAIRAFIARKSISRLYATPGAAFPIPPVEGIVSVAQNDEGEGGD